MTSTISRGDIPTIDDDSAPYWQGFKEGRLLLAKCGACGHLHHYPRPLCPECWSGDVTPFEASGEAVLYTFSTVFMNDIAPFPDRLPYVAALVELAEGPRIMTNIVDCDPATLRVGMPVRVDFRELDEEINVPVFRLIES